MTEKADINRNTIDGYAKWLAWNYDTVQECYGTIFPAGFADRLDEFQQLARDKHEGQGTTFLFNGEPFQIWSGGSGGNRWVIEDDDLQFHFRTEKSGWNTSVRYLAAGLWEHGIDRLKERVIDLLGGEGFLPYNEQGKNEDWIRLTRVDFAIDLHSPSFSMEQIPGLVANNLLLTSGVKACIWFNSRRNETIQIGQSKNSLQIQIYDKGKELTDKPGKEWMYDIWTLAGYDAPLDENGKKRARDVWRFEVRFGKEFLKDRNVRTFEAFHEKYRALIAEALERRRMIAPTINGAHVGLDYAHRERLDLHPLWAEVLALLPTRQPFVPRGRMITMRRKYYIEMLEKQQAGLGRSLSCAKYGAYDEESALEDAENSVKIAIEDKKHDDKIDKCLERQMFIDEAK